MIRYLVIPFIVLLVSWPAHGLDWAGKVQKDIGDLSSPDVQVRLRALARVGRYRDRKVRPLVLKALKDVDPKVQHLAASIAAERGIREAVPVLMGWLSHWDKDSRLSAAENLGDLGDPKAVKSLVRVLVDPDIKVRLEVIEALGKLSSPGNEEVVPLLGRLRDTSSKVRKAAVQVLASKKDPRAVIPLMGRLEDAAREVRIAAIHALGQLGDPKAGPSLVRLLRYPNYGVVSVVIKTLGHLRYIGATEPLIDLFKSGSSTHRHDAAAALGRIGTDLAIRALVAGLGSPNLRPAAKTALVEVGVKASPFISELLRDPRTSRGVTVAAAEVARDAKLRQPVPLLIQHIRLGKLPLRLLIATLGHISDPRAQRPLLDLLHHPSLDIRLAALRALRSTIDGRAAEPLVRLLSDRSRPLRLKVIGYLGRLRARLATPALLRIAEGNDRGLARAAVMALSQSRDSQSFPALIRLLSHQDRSLRRLAAQALARIREPRSVKPLLQLCRDSLGSVRVVCLQALGGVLRGRSSEDAVVLLRELIAGKDRSAFLAAADAVGAMRAPEATRALIERYPRLDAPLQRKVLEVLGSTPAPGSSALSHLLSVLGSDQSKLKSAAAWSLGKIKRAQALRRLLSAARDPSWEVRVNAVAALTRLRAKQARPLFRMLASDPVAYVRANAVLGLGETGDIQSRRLLAKKVIDDRSPWVRINAVRALHKLQPRGRIRSGDGQRAWANIKALVRSVAKEDLDARVRAIASRLRSTVAMEDLDTWVGLYLLDYRRRPLRNTQVILITPSGLLRAAYSDGRAELWEENLAPGYCYSELPSPSLTLNKTKGDER